MPWVRFDDQFPIHRKVAGLTDRAFRLHLEAIFWCARNLTDGRILAADLPQICRRFAAGKRSLQPHIDILLDRDLWHLAGYDCPSEKCPAPVDGDGWVIHDYWAYQPSKARVVKEREATARRQAAWRAAHSNAVTEATSNGVSAAVSNAPPGPARPYRGTGSNQGDRPRGRARDPDFTQNGNPGEGAAARHPSARTPTEAAEAAGLEAARKPARGDTVTAYADAIRKAITKAAGDP